MRLNAKQIAACTGGAFVVEPLDARALVTGLTWDSRDVRAGDVYVALPGERVDGHDFIGAALRGGAVCALVMQPLDEAVRVLATELGACIIEVPDTAHAVADIAAEWRGHLHGRVIALTGSTGKTTTKNLVRDVLASTLTVVATAGNQNNELGVPKTLLAAEQDTQAVVVEMGMRGAGQLADLCDYVRPDWGLVVNVGESHIELLGSRENIARAKAELLCALPEGTGRAFVNADDDYADFVREHARLDARRVETVLFDGSAAAAERRAGADAARPAVWAEQVELDEQGRPRFELHAVGFDGADGAEEGAPCALTLRGLHNVSNACAAAAVGRACGIPLAVCADALAHAEPEAGRQEVVRARGGFTVVNDAYNANPDSMRASLATFCALDVPGKHVAVLGDMGELGSYAPACHAGIGTFAATLPLDRLVCVGELSLHIADAAERAGMEPDRIVRAGSLSEVFGDLDTCVEPGDAVLVKASHFMGLERVVEGLVN
ncbi:UDP-N-acetylmuramoyl-tripeptide--D-alanyl-D-alanine ligase [Eggerthella guodeyinii]|uniref:UDP-N-acetylmuramoyl-tripeptide--D-alanyl-D-alanine ligase n=1 Tax=Eggerthella guodeyinii TaxID=2690837 RepID=A0A6N7RQU3_9ACTN|nr:UDP-N-acetylmuramoyl-tripeptide--D-alanyl-D-alanine ligase [Eggerthella guodeyinii]MRX83048.1 UDP-N-acetylmuramoyl-tripeptide--D-alanyl-D-alanine ligase [Eggerthella guodeyinii]